MNSRAYQFTNRILNNIKNREQLLLPQQCLNLEETKDLCNIIKNNNYYKKDETFLKNQFIKYIVPGVDDTSKLKAELLNNIINGNIKSKLINPREAIEILGTMKGGYNVDILTNLIEHEEYGELAVENLKDIILIFDNFNKVSELSQKGNKNASNLIESWARGDWYLNTPEIEENINVDIFKVDGEINTDDLSPAQNADSRPDIPLHALYMLKNPRSGIIPDKDFEQGPIKQILEMRKHNKVAFAGDIVGTGSSRKSATNSLNWYFGKSIPYVSNKKTGSICLGSKIAPIFYNTMEDSGGFPIELNTADFKMGDNITINPYEKICISKNGNNIEKFEYKTPTFLDSVRVGGRINLIIGKSLSLRSQEFLDKSNMKHSIQIPWSENELQSKDSKKGYTLAQKIVGKACGKNGVRPGEYCEPIITSVGSQDTTGPMTRDELKDLACLGFSADLVMQSFCHTSAYPKPIDLINQQTLPQFIHNRGGISLKPGDGIIHSWLNRMLLPDTVGTGGDSHTRFPIGISFPAGSGLVAFSAATGIMPLNMPESILVKFSGSLQPGITLRDLVHSIPYYAMKNGLLNLDKKNKKNIFNGRILEIEGLENLTCEQAFELSDASAERSAAGCTIQLNKSSIIEYLKSNISLLNWMIDNNYNDKQSLKRRIKKMEEWLSNPKLLRRDKDAEYHSIININMDDIKEPILCAPNDPDAAILLSEAKNDKIDEVFIGSCMTNIGHFRAAGKLLQKNNEITSKLWISPPTKMDKMKLEVEGYYDIFTNPNINLEPPGCSLCMGNQARVNDNSSVVSTSTRNFPNRLGKGANVYLGSAEVAAITAILGYIPSFEDYIKYFHLIDKDKNNIYRYLDFSKEFQIPDYDLEVNPYLIDNKLKDLTPEIEYLKKRDFIAKQKYLLLKYQL
jgi:aconitate hydratase 2/2-methylisocitrate dehydratase